MHTAQAKYTVLVVEDDAGVATLERRRLERAGYAVFTVATANEAIDILSRQAIDLVLLDYRLPENIDGLQFYSRMKDAGFDVPVILVTGFSNEATVIQALRTGIRDFVSKSVEYLDYLPEAVGRVMRQVETERQLVESEQRFRAMADGAPVFIWVSDENNLRTFVNRRWLEFRGREMDDELGQGWEEAIHPEDREERLAVIEEANRNCTAFTVEYRAKAASGRYHWILDSGTPRFNSNGRCYGFIGSAMDISDRRQAEEARRLLGAAVEQSNDAILIMPAGEHAINGNGVVFANPAFTSLTGYTKSDISNVVLEILQGPKTNREIYDVLRKAITDGKPFSGEITQYRKDGSEFIVDWQVSPLRDSRGVITHFVSTQRDITERKESEAKLRESEQRFQTFLDNCPAIGYVKDSSGRYHYVSGMIERYFGWKPSFQIGKTDEELWPPKVAAQLREHDEYVFSTNKPIEVEEALPTRKGQTSHWIVMRFPLPERLGQKMIGAMGIDITEHKLTEEKYRHAQKMEAVGQLAGGVAHDFNNLLTGILGYSQLLLGRVTEPSQRSDLSTIHMLGERAAALTSQLLAFSRRQPLQPIVTNLSTLVERTAKMLKRLIGEHIDLEFQSDQHVGNVKADPGQIEQVLMNLTINARDAMPRGGKLTIEVSDVNISKLQAELTASALHPGPHAMLAVTDNGTGMPSEVKDRIFEPFFTTKETGKGTGLGLSMAYGIIKQHNGHIEVYSEQGKGTSFKIYLPRVDEDSDPDFTLAMDDAPAGTEIILLVEDEDSVRDIATRSLNMHGYRVLAASNVAEATNLFHEVGGAVDLLMTDVVMPGNSGIELYQELKKSQPALKVMFMSGYTDTALTHQGLMEKDTPFIKKPFDPITLTYKVRQVLDSTPQ